MYMGFFRQEGRVVSPDEIASLGAKLVKGLASETSKRESSLVPRPRLQVG